MSLKVSVVLCTYNRAGRVGTCLKALLEQSVPADEYEVIVVNDGSTDSTAEVLKAYDVRVITNTPNQGLAQSRNNGAMAAKAAILAFTDDDCVPDKDWLAQLLGQYADPGIAGVGGKIVPYKTDKWLLEYYAANNPLAQVAFTFNNSSSIFSALLAYVKRSFSLRQLPETNIKLHMIVGANMSMRRPIFDAVGGFDSNIKFGGEEEDFWTRLHQLHPDVKLLYAPLAIVGHNYEPSFRDAIRRNKSYGAGAARTYTKDPSRLPVLYPFPWLIVFSLGLLVISPYFLLFSALLTLALYAGWVRLAVQKRRIRYLLYAYVQMFLELVNDYGFVRGYIRLTMNARRDQKEK